MRKNWTISQLSHKKCYSSHVHGQVERVVGVLGLPVVFCWDTCAVTCKVMIFSKVPVTVLAAIITNLFVNLNTYMNVNFIYQRKKKA